MDTKERSTEAIKFFLKREYDFEYIGDASDDVLVFFNSDVNEYVFVKTNIRVLSNSFEDQELDRNEMEMTMLKWFTENEQDALNCSIVFSSFDLNVIGDNKAIIRYHHNCFSNVNEE